MSERSRDLLFILVPVKNSVLVFFILMPWLCSAQIPHAIMPDMDAAYFEMVVHALASDSMKGRLPGTPEENKAATFIAGEFQRIGCKPVKRKRFVTPFDYLGPDSVMIHSSGNVIAKVNTPSEYCIVVTAHYDHIGYGQHHSNDPFTKGIHNGADDNASGVAMLLALARWCKDSCAMLNYDIVFVAVSGEEDGLHGSQALLKSGLIDTSRILCNLNFDMVGHLDLLRPLLVLEGAMEHEVWTKILPSDSADGFLVQRRPVRFSDGSDHCTFLNAGIPAIMLSTGITQFYHRTTDDADKLNYPGMEYIGRYTWLLIRCLNIPQAPAYFLRSAS